MILLDTNALIALAEGWAMRPAARLAVADAIAEGALVVSATSAWEVGRLATRTGRTATLFGGDARRWFVRIVAAARLGVVALDAETALAAAYLPGDPPDDPADRWIIATGRLNGAAIITSDRAILAYAAQGHLDAIRR